MVVSKISKEDLSNDEKYNDIFFIIKYILNCAFTIEDIIAEDELISTL